MSGVRALAGGIAGCARVRRSTPAGRWLDDPANPRKAWDGMGGFNSLLVED